MMMMEMEYWRWVNNVAHTLVGLEAHTKPQAVLKAFLSQLAEMPTPAFSYILLACELIPVCNEFLIAMPPEGDGWGSKGRREA